MTDKNKQFTEDKILPIKFVKKAHAWVVTFFKNSNQNQNFFVSRKEAEQFITKLGGEK